MKKISWLLWIALTLGLAGYFGYTLMYEDDKTEFLIGATSYGHYQIELACSSCHSDPFGGPEAIQQACVNCHGQELTEAHDSHPRKKFTDPREAFRLEVIDARYCISCLTEHRPEQTHAMGVTLPDDYCFHCHADVVKERKSHKDLPFDSCASAGCHNFHDNRALYERFLLDNANQPWLKEIARITQASYTHHFASKGHLPQSGSLSEQEQQQIQQHPQIQQQWQHSAHAEGNVSCSDCHSSEGSDQWLEHPGIDQCRNCHRNEAEGFLSGKHGMRLADTVKAQLAPISPAESPLAFKNTSLNVQHGCNSCHQSHTFDTRFAAVDACLQCHNDDHSNAFITSPHGKLWQQAASGLLPLGNSVSCATCHLPRTPVDAHGTDVESINAGGIAQMDSSESAPILRVEHNQNLFLRPNEKMIRPVCMQCHSLEFSIDALADPVLIKNNFKGQPSVHIPSMDWARAREVKKRTSGDKTSSNNSTIQE